MEPLTFSTYAHSTGSRIYRGFRYWKRTDGNGPLTLVQAWYEGGSEDFATDGSAEALEQLRRFYSEVLGVNEAEFYSFRKA